MSRVQSIITSALTLSIVAAMAGVPTPTLHAPQKGAWFPCRDHRCGCASAEQCLKGCCCYGDKTAHGEDTHHHAFQVTLGALECRGISLNIASVPPQLPPIPITRPDQHAICDEPLAVHASQLIPQHAPVPDSPPPQA